MNIIHRHMRVPAGVAVAVILAFSLRASAQMAPGMNGRALDASNQVGAGGINAATPPAYFNAANLYVTGNVTGGRGFRGYSPIRSSSSMFLSLPTARFDAFYRNTFGASNIGPDSLNWQYRSYYDPTSTVTTVQSVNSHSSYPTTDAPKTTYLGPQQTAGTWAVDQPDLRYGYMATQPLKPTSPTNAPENTPFIQPLYTGAPADPTVRALRNSPLFGRSEVATQPLTAGSTIRPMYPEPSAVGQQTNAMPSPWANVTTPPNDYAQAPPTSEEMLARSRELISPTAIAPRLFDRPADQPLQPRNVLTGRPLPTAQTYLVKPEGFEENPIAARDMPSQEAGRLTPPVESFQQSRTLAGEPFVPGEPDRFAELAAAANVISDEQQQEEGEAPSALPPIPNLKERYEQAVNTVQNITDEVVETLAGNRETKANQYIRRAEDLVRKGEYYRASTLYNLASAIEPENPLIRLGHGNALLAAGEYLTAVNEITSAIEAYPAVAYLKLDLNRFVHDPTVLDIRRADLEDRLGRKEDYRLQFLLGYTEYYTGLEKFGMPDLEKAAAEAPKGSVIASFPQMLKDAAGVKKQPAPPILTPADGAKTSPDDER